MAYSVFLSHSMTREDQPFVRTIAETLGIQGIQCYIAERDVQPGQALAGKIELAIRNCDCLVALLTKGGSQSAYVNQEIGFAAALPKPIVPIVEKGYSISGLKVGVEWVEFDRADPQAALLKLIPHLVREASTKQVVSFIGMAVLGGLGLWLANKN
jgi:hypothetical protein